MTRTPAQDLEGRELPSGWRVVKAVTRSPNSTGGNFSHGYIVVDSKGRKAFLKALDFSLAFKSPDPAQSLKNMTEAFVFERDLCKTCSNRNLKRVTVAIDDGVIKTDSIPVQYLIFELAQGDVREYLRFQQKFDIAWTLRTLHHTAVGLNQLHSAGIAHQDLKPSNVLVFDDGSKVADLGRAASKHATSPHDDYEIAGDRSYAPPELLYHFVSSDWNPRRYGCDIYHLGSIIAFFFSGVQMTALIADKIALGYHWQDYKGSYEEALPYVRAAFGEGLQAIRDDFPPAIRDTLLGVIRQLCDPDPKLRGNPRIRQEGRNQYSLDKYISQFDLLASKAEFGLLKG